MAALISERCGADVETTPTQKSGEFTVFVDGERVIKKFLPFIRPSDEKVLAAVQAALS